MTASPSGLLWEAAACERNWLVYKLVPRPGKKPAKLPTDPDNGRETISLYAAARLTLVEAQTAAAMHNLGIGYLPRPSSLMIGIDLDNSIAPWDDEPDPWAAEMLERCVTWVERSPSGTGIRVLARRQGSIGEPVDTERNGKGVFAAGGRFFTVTFDPLPGYPMELNAARPLVQAILTAGRPAEGEPVSRNNSDAPHWFDRLPEARQLQEVERMLGCLNDPKLAEYDRWLRISFAVYATTDSRGFDIWDRWCQKLPGYNATENIKKWDSLYSRRPNKISAGTLIFLATEHGYKPPADAHGAAPHLLARLAKLSRTLDIPPVQRASQRRRRLRQLLEHV